MNHYDYSADAIECGYDESEFDGLQWIPYPPEQGEEEEGVPVVILPKFWQTF